MQRSNKVFTPRERRMALYAVIAVVAITVLGLATGGLFNPSVGTGGRSGYGFADLPGVSDATPLG